MLLGLAVSPVAGELLSNTFSSVLFVFLYGLHPAGDGDRRDSGRVQE